MFKLILQILIFTVLPFLNLIAMDDFSNSHDTSHRMICVNLKSDLIISCDPNQSNIKVSNNSGVDILFIVKYKYFADVHVKKAENLSIEKKPKYKSFKKDSDKEIAYKEVEYMGESKIIANGQETIIYPREIVIDSRIWSPEEISGISKFYVMPIINGKLSKLRSKFKKVVLNDIDNLETNIFIVDKRNGKLCFNYLKDEWDEKIQQTSDNFEKQEIE
ncbi:hypothetical protein M1446_02630 [Candidatus Dependentiae bacterium]|nr:hypothetical protein [Candidatus Dependentiae bacterium]